MIGTGMEARAPGRSRNLDRTSMSLGNMLAKRDLSVLSNIRLF